MLNVLTTRKVIQWSQFPLIMQIILPNTAGAAKLGEAFGDSLSKSGVETIVFDRAGRKYHGCVKVFADSLRNKNIKF